MNMSGPTRWSLALVAALLPLGVSTGCSKSSTAPDSTNTGTNPGVTTVTVSIVGSAGNQAFSPNPVAAATGNNVVFKNNDSTLHHIVLDDNSADLGDIAPGATSQALAVKSQTALLFHCKIHGSMVGSLNGLTAPTPPCTVDIYGNPCTGFTGRK
jgi:plastocyanin